MKIEMNYIKDNYRWVNYKEFIDKKIENKTKKKVLFLVLTYNSANALIKNTQKIHKDKVDFLIIDNFSNKENTNKLIDYVNKNKFSYIRLNENLGGAGGYSMGIEYFLANKQYKDIIICEDDVYTSENNILNEMVKNKKDYDQLRVIYKELGVPSFGLHFYLYSREIIERIGCLDVNYFMRSDDYEFGSRKRKVFHKLKTNVLKDINYSHPCLKDNEKYSTIYFITRNNLKTFMRHHKKDFILYSFFYILNDIMQIFLSKNKKLLKIRLIAYKDFLLNNFNMKRNKYILQNYNIKINDKEKKNMTIKNFLKELKNNNTIDKMFIRISNANKLEVNKKINLKEMITRDYVPRTSFLYSLVKKLIIIYEYDKQIYYEEKYNNQFLNFIILLISLPLTIILYIPFLIFSLIRYICGKIWKNTM